jgi:hypothetical protein
MARTLKELKESRKRKLVIKPHTTIIPHMRVIYDENADDDEENTVQEPVAQPVAEPVVQNPQPEVNDDFQPPPHTPPTMNPVTVCPLAPVKPKEQNNIVMSLASAMIDF